MTLINQTSQLIEELNHFKHSPFVTIDTEFIRETTFWPKLCLIQLAIPGKVILIDPLAEDIDLSSFFELMANQDVVKVFHAARQDIEIIYNLSKIIPSPIFDTQIAAMVCGYRESISYEQLVRDISKKTISKTLRFTDWKSRPLTPEQLEYAKSDVTYLIDIYLYLKAEMEKKNRTDWGNEELALLENKEIYEAPPEQSWKRIKFNFKKAEELAVLQKLSFWRECEARKHNVPRQHILKDEILVQLAQQQPKTESKLLKMRRFPINANKSDYLSAILQCIQDGLATAPESLPKLPTAKSLPKGTQSKVEILKFLLKIISEKENVNAKVIASSEDLEYLVITKDKNSSVLLNTWRKDIFGAKALELLDGKLAIKVNNGEVVFFNHKEND